MYLSALLLVFGGGGGSFAMALRKGGCGFVGFFVGLDISISAGSAAVFAVLVGCVRRVLQREADNTVL